MSETLILLVVAGVSVAMVPLSFVMLIRATKRIQQRVRERLEYDELPCDPVVPGELPAKARTYFDDLTPEVTALGFRQIGEHRTRSEPLTLVRRFLSSDGQTFAELVYVRIGLLVPMRAFDFISVLPDGTYLESANVRQPPPPADPRVARRFHLLGLPKASVDEVYRRHREAVDELTGAGAEEPLRFEPGQIREVGTYGHQLVAWDRRFRCGTESEPPEFPFAEAACLVEA